jgi:hypothetical protein
MDAPTMCPHCGSESIQPVFLYATLSVSFDRMHSTISGLHAYRCDNTHFFIVFGARKDIEESDGEAREALIRSGFEGDALQAAREYRKNTAAFGRCGTSPRLDPRVRRQNAEYTVEESSVSRLKEPK